MFIQFWCLLWEAAVSRQENERNDIYCIGSVQAGDCVTSAAWIKMHVRTPNSYMLCKSFFFFCVQLLQLVSGNSRAACWRSSRALLTVNYPLGIFCCCTVDQVHEVILIKRCIAPWFYSSGWVWFIGRCFLGPHSQGSSLAISGDSFWTRCINQLLVGFWVLRILIEVEIRPLGEGCHVGITLTVTVLPATQSASKWVIPVETEDPATTFLYSHSYD